jgi:cation diffusion facilitator CzcD-associated flavoprotein CzcO
VSEVFAAIVGTGFAGLGMAIKLKEAGIHDLVLLERSDDIGGTWRDNHYPGCACDVPSHLYSFSFEPNPSWSKNYPEQPEIQAYVQRTAEKYGLREHLRFGAEIVAARWDEAQLRWIVEAKDGRRWRARVLISAVGGLSRPLLPELPGLSRFAGPRFHSAAWDHGVPLADREVAVIGTGASAIQFVPRIAAQVRRLRVFQRTPPWILPRADRTFGPLDRALLSLGPVRWLHRQRLYWTHELCGIGFTLDPRLLRVAERLATRHLLRSVPDPELRRKLTPQYAMGCKRILLSNDYLPALTRPNVELVTEPIREVVEQGIVTRDGREHRAEVLIFGTGFDVHNHGAGVRIEGRGSRTLNAAWRDGAEAYLGTTVAGFPNLFILIGPNTGLGHNSIILMIESQVRYVVNAIRAMRSRELSTVEVRPEVMRRYNADLERRLSRTVWHSGCASWYRDARGRNTTLWPGFTFEFKSKTRRFHLRDYASARL